ncbi:MAG: hypothetical protein WC856_26260 [Methylococcaceae bacterium]|jgi:hypothetical protein
MSTIENTDDENPKKDDPSSEKPAASSSLFDPSKLRLSQNFAESVGVKKLVTTVPVRKPNKQDFIRVHPDPAYRLETAVLELKEERETYLVAPDLWLELPGELIPKVLFTAMNRQKVLFVWPVRLPGEDGRHDQWNASALEAATMAQKDWIRISANMGLGAYEIFQSIGDLPDPEWPEMEFSKILEIAFKGHYITSLDHPALRRLRGEL